MAGGRGRGRGPGLRPPPHRHRGHGGALAPRRGAPRHEPQDGLLALPEQDRQWHPLLRGQERRQWGQCRQWLEPSDQAHQTAEPSEEDPVLGVRDPGVLRGGHVHPVHPGHGLDPGLGAEQGGAAQDAAGELQQTLQVQPVPVLSDHHHLGQQGGLLRHLHAQVGL